MLGCCASGVPTSVAEGVRGRAQVAATRRQLIQHAVDLPFREAAWLLHKPSTAHESDAQPDLPGRKSAMSRTRFIKLVQQRHVHNR